MLPYDNMRLVLGCGNVVPAATLWCGNVGTHVAVEQRWHTTTLAGTTLWWGNVGTHVGVTLNIGDTGGLHATSPSRACDQTFNECNYY